MELTTTLPAEKILKRSYKHYSFPPPVEVEVAPISKKLDFFYVGKKTGVIDLLINTFESGYAAENMENAKSMLVRLADQRNSTPDIIVIEASIGFSQIQDFNKFLSSRKGFQKTPIIIDASNSHPEALDRFRGLTFVDEIVPLSEYSQEALVTKVNFWKKVKQATIRDLNVSNIETPAESAATWFKRVFDIFAALFLLILLSPVFLLVILALRIESKGPLFYISKRAGRGYKIFNFYKFRTMVVDADQQIEEMSHLNQYQCSTNEFPVFIKITNDPRVTRLGAFLRSTSLDELPQLVNVLKGDMSLVGNRPLPLYEAVSLTTDEWAKRFMAPAGITGLWQIKKKGKQSMSVEERINLDINYADRYNFLYDLWIIANTPSALIQKTNA